MTQDAENTGSSPASAVDEAAAVAVSADGPALTMAQLRWLARGLDQPGGKLPLFDDEGQRVSTRTVESCIKHGWAAPWFNNPLKPDWLVCKLTEAGRAQVEAAQAEDALADGDDDDNIVPLRR